MTCPVCGQEISKGTTITCFGMCKRKFHLTCLALSVEDIKRILEKDMKYKCSVKYCFIGNGYNYFISYKQRELGYLVSKIESELDNIDNLFKSYSSTVQNLTNGLNDFEEEFRKLKDRYDEKSPLEEDKSPNVSSKPITLDELVSNGWVASKNNRLLKKSFEFENGSSAISFINRTSKVLEKEPNNNMPQITLQIKTVTVVLASKEQEDKLDKMMLKTANMIDGAQVSGSEKDKPRVKQGQNESRPKVDENNNSEQQSQGSDSGDDDEDYDDDEEEDDDDDDTESQKQPRYFY